MTKQPNIQHPTDQTASKKESQAKSGAFSEQVLKQQVIIWKLPHQNIGYV